MSTNIIKRITIVTNSKSYAVGSDGIGRIKDSTIEYSDSIHWCFQVFDENADMIAEIVNCPVEVEYYRN